MIRTKKYTTFVPSGLVARESPDEFGKRFSKCGCCGALWQRTDYWNGGLFATNKQLYVLDFLILDYISEVKYVCGGCKELIADKDKTEMRQNNG